jgi:hypothetical protein
MSLIRPTLAASLSIAGLLASLTVVHAQVPKTSAPAKQSAPAAKPVLPAAVAAAFKQAYPNATITTFSSETEDGKVEWEIESVDGKTRRDIVYLADGSVQVIEEQIAVTAVPAPVLAAFKARFPKATVTRYEKVNKGSAISYEMTMTGANVKEAELAPDGTFINPKPVKK